MAARPDSVPGLCVSFAELEIPLQNGWHAVRTGDLKGNLLRLSVPNVETIRTLGPESRLHVRFVCERVWCVANITYPRDTHCEGRR